MQTIDELLLISNKRGFVTVNGVTFNGGWTCGAIGYVGNIGRKSPPSPDYIDFVACFFPIQNSCPVFMNLHDIRELASTYSLAELDQMISTMATTEAETLLTNPAISERFNTLVKAKTVRELTDSGMSVQDALRELGGRMRRGIGRERS
ncbi:MAG: hypothetical protein KDD67_16665 [Ignavibacteriae bacterium]|nr:hypothetical protein [Ignavibacteriota bacterium]